MLSGLLGVTNGLPGFIRGHCWVARFVGGHCCVARFY